MRKTLVTLGLLASLAAPGFATTAQADQYRDPDDYRYRHENYRYENRPSARHDWAWSIVRRDPCRYDEYRRFARRHENPNKRRRVIEQLAREGCHHDRRDHVVYRDQYDR
jgi:hypothetical protein